MAGRAAAGLSHNVHRVRIAGKPVRVVVAHKPKRAQNLRNERELRVVVAGAPQPLHSGRAGRDNRAVEVTSTINRYELRRYLDRVGDRWPIEVAWLGGARVADEKGAPPQRERGPEYVLILVSSAYEGMPWLERVYQAGALWDALEMGARADVHCYTPKEFERKRSSLPAVRAAVERGLDLLAEA